MPTTTDLVSPNAIIRAMKVNGKKQALQEIAAKAASLTGQNEKAIFKSRSVKSSLDWVGMASPSRTASYRAHNVFDCSRG